MRSRKVADCRKFPSNIFCSVTISGTEEEVLPLALYHAIMVHCHDDTPDLYDHIRAGLSDEQNSPEDQDELSTRGKIFTAC